MTVTRRDAIEKAKREWLQESQKGQIAIVNHFELQKSYGFIAGAEWADANPFGTGINQAYQARIEELKQKVKTRDQAIELARENMAKIIENMKPSEGDCMTCDNWPDRKQHHEECPYSNLVDTLTAIDNLLKGQK